MNRLAGGEDLFDEVGEIVPALPPKQGRVPAPSSRGSTPTLGSIAVPRPPSRRGAEVRLETVSFSTYWPRASRLLQTVLFTPTSVQKTFQGR